MYIMADEHASNAVSIYRSHLASVMQNPNLDRIAHEGAVLNNCHCTNSICTPIRASILAGQYSKEELLNSRYDNLKMSVADAKKFNMAMFI